MLLFNWDVRGIPGNIGLARAADFDCAAYSECDDGGEYTEVQGDFYSGVLWADHGVVLWNYGELFPFIAEVICFSLISIFCLDLGYRDQKKCLKLICLNCY